MAAAVAAGAGAGAAKGGGATAAAAADTQLANRLIRSALTFRLARAADLAPVYALEVDGYPADEAASLQSLTYRVNNAGQFFMIAELPAALTPDAAAKGSAGVKAALASASASKAQAKTIVGFVCGTLTRSAHLTHDTMFAHVALPQGGRYLCVHSVVMARAWRRRGLAAVMMRAYVSALLPAYNTFHPRAPIPAADAAPAAAHGHGHGHGADAKHSAPPSDAPAPGPVAPALAGVFLICKAALIGFYTSADVGFRLDGPSDVVHGQEKWYQCSLFFK